MIDLFFSTQLLLAKPTEPPTVPHRGSGRREMVIEEPILIASSQVGIASWYGGYFHGRRTASGVRYNKWGNTCAHNRYKFGTRLRVTNLSNGRVVICKVTDRGGFTRLGRAIDMSRGQARQLGFEQRGLTRVKIEKIGG